MGKRKICYLFALIIVILINITISQYTPFITLIIMIFLPVILVTYSLILSKFIVIHLKVKEKSGVRGDKIDFEIIAINSSILPVSNVVVTMEYKYNNCTDSMKKKFSLNCKGADKTMISGTMLLNYCGELNVRVANLYAYDALKIFKLKIKCSESETITVMPKLIEPDFLTSYTPENNLQDSQYYSKKRSGDDPSEIFDLRQYREGDNFNRIHWKLSAKEDELFVKEFSMPINKTNVILVELLEGDTEEKRKNLDGVFEMAYAIGNFACRKESVFQIAFYSTKVNDLIVLDVENQDMLVDAITLLIKEGTYPKTPYGMHELRMGELSEAQRVYYIISDMNEEIIEFLDETKDTEFFVYIMDDGIFKSESLEIEGALLMNVDRNDIKQGLKTILI